MSDLYEKVEVPVEPVPTQTLYRCKACGQNFKYESDLRRHYWHAHASEQCKTAHLELDPEAEISLDSTFQHFPSQELFNLYIDTQDGLFDLNKKSWCGSGWYETWFDQDDDRYIRSISDSIGTLRALSERLEEKLQRLTKMMVEGGDYFKETE
jgi:hypothetical protein